MSAAARIEKLERKAPRPGGGFWDDLLADIAKNGKSLVSIDEEADDTARTDKSVRDESK